MKIGILNFHRALNYGAVLQCYGLQETLTALGHEVSVIDYRPRIIEKHRSYFLFDILKEKGIIPFIRIHYLLYPINISVKKLLMIFYPNI